MRVSARVGFRKRKKKIKRKITNVNIFIFFSRVDIDGRADTVVSDVRARTTVRSRARKTNRPPTEASPCVISRHVRRDIARTGTETNVLVSHAHTQISGSVRMMVFGCFGKNKNNRQTRYDNNLRRVFRD